MDWIDEAQAVIESESPERAAWLRERLFGETRNIWTLFSNLSADSRVLIVGAEWGSSVSGVSRVAGDVSAIPATDESTRILRSRLEEEQIAGTTLLETDVVPPLPFEDETLDAVVIAPPLEEFLVALAGRGVSSKAFYQDVSRVLKGSGCLHFTSNRIRVGTTGPKLLKALDYFRSLGSEARVFNGVRRLLSSGFEAVHFYGGSSEFGFSGGLHCSRYGARGTVVEVVQALKDELEHPSAIYLAWKSRTSRSFVEHLAAQWSPAATFTGRVAVSGTGMMVAEVVDPHAASGSSTILRVSFSEFGAQRAQNNAQRLEQLEGILASGTALPALVPRVLDSGEVEGRAYSFETKLPGVSRSRLGVGPESLPRVHRQATDFLVALHAATARPTAMDAHNLADLLTGPIVRLLDFARDPTERERLDSLARYVDRVLGGRTIPLVFIHGDFWVGNLLFEPGTGDLRSVVDWDMSRDGGLPLIDLLTMFLLSSRHYPDGADPYQRLFDFDWAASDLELVDRYCAQLGLDDDLRLALAISTWTFELGSVRIRHRVAPRSWLETKLYQPLARAAAKVASRV